MGITDNTWATAYGLRGFSRTPVDTVEHILIWVTNSVGFSHSTEVYDVDTLEKSLVVDIQSNKVVIKGYEDMDWDLSWDKDPVLILIEICNSFDCLGDLITFGLFREGYFEYYYSIYLSKPPKLTLWIISI